MGDGQRYVMRTERLGFRCWAAKDLPLAVAIWGQPAVTRLIADLANPSEEQARRRLAREMPSPQQVAGVVETRLGHAFIVGVAAIAAGLTAPRIPLTALVAAVGLLGLGGAITVAASKRPAPSPTAVEFVPSPRPAPQGTTPGRGRTDRPVVTLAGQVLDAAGRPVPHAEVTALARRPFRAGDFGLRETGG
jgi:hypothetical protein